MLTVFLKVISIFCMIAVGFFASKKGVLTMESNQHLTTVLLSIANPCLIFSSIVSQELSDRILRQSVEILAGSVVFFLAASAVALLLVKVIGYSPREDRGVVMVIITSVNSGFMGFPVTKAIFGDQMFFLMVIENIVLNFYLYTLSIMQMNYGRQGKNSWRENLRPLLNLCTLAMVVGLAMFITGLRPPAIVVDFFDTMGSATIPISMLVVGIQLAYSDLGRMVRNGRLILVSLCNVLLIPLLTLLAVHWLPLTNEAKLILVYAACFPCAVITVAMAAREGRNAALMAEGVALTTLLSLGTLPVFSVLLMHLYC